MSHTPSPPFDPNTGADQRHFAVRLPVFVNCFGEDGGFDTMDQSLTVP